MSTFKGGDSVKFLVFCIMPFQSEKGVKDDPSIRSMKTRIVYLKCNLNYFKYRINNDIVSAHRLFIVYCGRPTHLQPQVTYGYEALGI